MELEKEGGWLNKNTITAFRDYVQLIGKHFAGRVNHYYTINEIQIILKLGYATGEHAPGKTLTNDQIFIVAHNLLLAHGHAVSALREIDQNLKIGIASTGKLAYPKGETKSNLDTAYLTSFKVDENDWFFSHSLVLDPIVFGCYPEGLDKICPSYQDYINEGDLEIISAPLDMIGANIYNGQEVDIQGILVTRSPSFPRNSLGWPVTPKILHYGPLFLNKRYNLPIYITENGHSLLDEVGPNQRIDDSERIIFLENYLSNLKLALDDKADVRGYFHWSLTDNFEWHNGYQDRFGLVFIDYQNIKRIPKDSYFWFKNYIKKEKYPC